MPQQVMQNTTFSSGLDSLNKGTQSILDVFVVQGLVSVKDAEVLKKRYKTNRQVEEVLLRNRIVSRDTINKAYSILLKVPYISIENYKIPKEALMALPPTYAKNYGIIPFGFSNGILQIALSRPSDLNANYSKKIENFFQDKHLTIELYITGQKDFDIALAQYKNQNKDLLETSSYPTVYLRNQNLSSETLGKLPLDFIQKFRAVVFYKKSDGLFAVATESPSDAILKKALSEIEEKNNVKFQIFATSEEDIDYAIAKFKEKFEKTAESIEQDEKKTLKPDKVEAKIESEPSDEDDIITFSNLFSSFAQKKERTPVLTIDSTVPEEPAPRPLSKPVISKEVDDRENQEKPPTSDLKNTDEDPEAGSSNLIEKSAEKEDSDIGSLLKEDVNTIDDLKRIAKENYIPKTVAAIINLALKMRASDIHVEPEQKKLRIRYRIDGILRDALDLPLSVHPAITSRIKILGKLKLDESRIPQDGRFDVIFLNHEVDVRVSSLPTVHGEKVVMRILDKSQGILSLEDLGMKGRAFDLTVSAIGKPYGIILSTGPTGSGKSTTLYAIINRISSPSVNIVTLEDPVEYEIPGVNQCQVKPQIGFTFAEGLRSVLRQDPNVIMVGEVRDGETAAMATHAALTGHLVLTTLHTNDASGALPRLINMGIEPFLITSSINLVIAQRLVRRICPKCSTEMKIPPILMDNVRKELKLIPENNKKDLLRIPETLKFYHGVGCKECENGFKGRVGIFEVLRVTEEIEELTVSKKSSNEIKSASIEDGMITMLQDGILKAFEGLTTIDEVFSATSNNLTLNQ